MKLDNSSKMRTPHSDRCRRCLALLLAVFCLIIAPIVRADKVWKIVHIKCDRKSNSFQITPFFAYGGKDGERDLKDARWRAVMNKRKLRVGNSTYYLGEGTIVSVCKLPAATIKTTIFYARPSNLSCGALPGGFLNVWQNGKEIVRAEKIQHCGEVRGGRIAFDARRGWRHCDGLENVSDMNDDPSNSCARIRRSSLDR